MDKDYNNVGTAEFPEERKVCIACGNELDNDYNGEICKECAEKKKRILIKRAIGGAGFIIAGTAIVIFGRKYIMANPEITREISYKVKSKAGSAVKWYRKAAGISKERFDSIVIKAAEETDGVETVRLVGRKAIISVRSGFGLLRKHVVIDFSKLRNGVAQIKGKCGRSMVPADFRSNVVKRLKKEVEE